MAGYDLKIHSSTDASEWARMFCEIISENKDIEISEEYMTGWFANAMMAMYDSVRREIDTRPLGD